MNEQHNPLAESWTAINDLFSRAIERATEERERFLAAACPDERIRDEVSRLLALADSAERFFEVFSGDLAFAAEPQLEPGWLISNRFRITRFLARGGMGEVYEAEDTELGGRLALKMMRASLSVREGGLSRFREEVRLTRSINSPNVCRAYDVGRDRDRDGNEFLYFTMELLDGATLAERLEERLRFSPSEAFEIARQMAAGLDAAHRAGILHRDLKPGNVMLCPDRERERVVITDFGISRAIDSSGRSGGATDGATPDYAAPEQLAGGPETQATDIYSFGVVLYEMMAGVTPSRSASLSKGAGDPVEYPKRPPAIRRDLPARWEKAILRCLEQAPARRFGTAGEVIAALAERPLPMARRTALLLACGAVGAGAAVWQRWGRIWIAGPPPSIAILPFQAGDERLVVFAEGIADRLSDAITLAPGVRVISRAAAERYGPAVQSLADFGKKFRVRYVVAGDVRGTPQRLHVTAEVIEASTGFQLWSGTFDFDSAQIETAAPTLNRAVIATLHLDAQPATLREFDRRLTSSPEAYQLFLLGRYYAARRTRESLEQSAEALSQAVKLDPSFASAYASLAFSYFDLSTRDREDWGDPLARSLAAAQRALSLDPNLADAHMVIACIKWRWQWDWKSAEEAFLKTLGLKPSLALAHRYYAQLLSWSARHQEAIREVDEALDLDPLNLSVQVLRATTRLYAGRIDDALQLYEAVAHANPEYENLYVPMADALEAEGKVGDAIASCERGVALTKRASYALSSLGRLYGITGRIRDAQQILEELLDRYARREASPVEVAYVYLGLGDRDRAFEWLGRGFAARSSNLLLLKVGPEFAPLRGDPRYAALMAQLKL